MPLSDQERAAFQHYLAILLEADEPEALLGSLQRLAERKAHGVTRGKIGAEEAERWLGLGRVLAKVRRGLKEHSHA